MNCFVFIVVWLDVVFFFIVLVVICWVGFLYLYEVVCLDVVFILFNEIGFKWFVELLLFLLL